MSTIYVSSTYKDLAAHRAAAAKALRKIGHRVICMEEYVARDRRSVETCLRDVANCDIYLGIFAWRYGWVPTTENSSRWSITEMEYRTAARTTPPKPRLIFLLGDKAQWPKSKRDENTGKQSPGGRIRALRNELKNLSFGSFSTPDSLAAEVLAAVVQHESERRVENFTLANDIKVAVDIGPSYLGNIREKLAAARDAEIVALNLGPTPWWTTRLHLVAALASDFTTIKQLQFLDNKGKFVTMASPQEVRRALTTRIPQAERAYLAGRAAAPNQTFPIESISMHYTTNIFDAFDNKIEKDVKEDVSSIMLTRDLGIQSSATVLDEPAGGGTPPQRDIVRCKTPYVVIVDRGKVVSILDRYHMVNQLALHATEELEATATDPRTRRNPGLFGRASRSTAE